MDARDGGRAMIDIVYEDNHVIVAVKPPNLLSQADQTGDADMLSMLKAYIKEKYHKPGDVYLGLVHRMDRPVGGLMVFARTSKAAARLAQQLKAHTMNREYLCVVNGIVEAPFTRTDYLKKDANRNVVAVVQETVSGAKKAVLMGTPLASRDGMTLLKIHLETGRSHQIRVQMMHMGHSLMGDHRYGMALAHEQIALWGYRLAFMHPTLQTEQVFYNLPNGAFFNQFTEVIHAQAI